VDGTDTGSSPVSGFCTDGIETSDCIIREVAGELIRFFAKKTELLEF
jgi:hypothetical protein